MKIIRTFVLTLVVVLGVGAFYLYGKDLLKGSDGIIEKSTNEIKEKISEGTDDVKKKAMQGIAETVVNEAIKQYAGDSAEDVQKVMDSVTAEDKEKVTEILTDNLSLEAIDDVKSYVSNNDVDGLMEYAQETLTAEEYNELTDIFQKYSEDALNSLDKAAD
jgi:hypothetical protein